MIDGTYFTGDDDEKTRRWDEREMGGQKQEQERREEQEREGAGWTGGEWGDAMEK